MKKLQYILIFLVCSVLLQDFSYCGAWTKEEMEQRNARVTQNILRDIDKAIFYAINNDQPFVNFGPFKRGSWIIFNKHFEKEFFGEMPFFRSEFSRSDNGLRNYLAHLATLAQDSPRYWNAQIKKIENIIKSTKPGILRRLVNRYTINTSKRFLTDEERKIREKAIKEDALKEAKFLYEVFLDSAARSYAFMEKEYLKNKAQEKWYHMPMRLLQTPPDFYILAVLHSIKVHMPDEFGDIKKEFIKNFRSYLESELPKANQEIKINDIMNQIEKKSTPSYLTRYWKWWLAGVVTTVGVSYWIYKNQESYQKGGFGGLVEEAKIEPKTEKVIEREFTDGTKEIINLNPETDVMTSKILETKDLDTGIIKERITTQYSELVGEPLTTKHEFLNKKTGKLEDESYQIQKNDTFRGYLDYKGTN